jgi:RNA methyltransferase, TrmH family
MLGKKEIKDIQSLDQKKFRDDRGLFVAEGPKIVRELLLEKRPMVQQLYATEGWIKQNSNILTGDCVAVSEQELARISQLKTPNEVLAVVRQQNDREPVISDQFCLYLDTIQDPGNLGTIIRIADWFGIPHIICSEGCADRYNAKVVQASMASILRVPVFYDTDLVWLQKQNVPVYAAALDGAPLQSFGKIRSGILVVGNESKGIRPAIMQLAKHQVTIKRVGRAESLNAAVATGILLSHLA